MGLSKCPSSSKQTIIQGDHTVTFALTVCRVGLGLHQLSCSDLIARPVISIS